MAPFADVQSPAAAIMVRLERSAAGKIIGTGFIIPDDALRHGQSVLPQISEKQNARGAYMHGLQHQARCLAATRN